MKTMIRFFLYFWSAVSLAGGWHIGGGDPYAQNFVNLSKKLSSFLKSNPQNIQIKFDSNQFGSIVEEISKSINNESPKDDLIVFISDKILVAGKEKVAKFDKETKQITINRDIWKNFTSDQDRYITIGMEVCGLMNCPLRYETMSNLVSSNYSYIDSQVLKNDSEYTIDGWRIVGEDSGVFSRMTKDHFLFKVADLGTGSKELKKDLELFSKNNRELATPIFKALSPKDGQGNAFILFENPYKTKSIIVNIYAQHDEKNNVYIKSYMLILSSKANFSAHCDSFQKPLSHLERVKDCYLNKNLYASRETLVQVQLDSNQTLENVNASIAELLNQTLKKVQLIYSYDRTVMEDMLRDNFFLNYSNVFFSTSDQYEYLIHSMISHGFEPDLVGPFTSQSNYWRKHLTRDFPQELYAAYSVESAAKYLAENNLVMATANIRCLKYDETKKNHIVARDTVDYTKPCIQTMMGLLPLDKRIEIEFATLGLKFNPNTLAWEKQQP